MYVFVRGLHGAKSTVTAPSLSPRYPAFSLIYSAMVVVVKANGEIGRVHGAIYKCYLALAGASCPARYSRAHDRGSVIATSVLS